MKKALINTLCELMSKDSNIYMLTGDLGFGVMDPIMENYPKRFFNMGICEQNMASVAAGIAMEGNTVYIYSIGNFPTLRCLEQIRNDISYHNANVKIIAVGGGFSYGNLGMSHHATEDIAIMRAIPGMTVLTPADPIETIQSVHLAQKINGPVYIRLGRGGEKNLPREAMELYGGNAFKLKSGENIAILAAGVIASDVLVASELLEKQGISAEVYSFMVVKPINKSFIKHFLSQMNYIFTVEEHNINGGFGGAVAEILAECDCKAKLMRIGMKDKFTNVVGSPAYLREYYGLNSEGIAKEIISTINGRG